MQATRVLFVVDRIGFLEILSIPILAATVRNAGHRVELVEFARSPTKALRFAQAYRPDVVAYSVCSNEAERYLHINAALKNHIKFLSVFGGPHPTFFPNYVLEPGVDAICRGEGDVVFPRMLDALGKDGMYETDNFSFQFPEKVVRANPLASLINDLDSLPVPYRDVVYSKSFFLAQSPIKSFFAGRGCPFQCTYCFNHAYQSLYRGKGRVIRTKSVGYLLEEIKGVASRFPLTFIKFQDDVLGIERAWLEEFSEAYAREIGLPFMCYARPNMITARYAKLLKKAGCFSVCIAIESGDEEMRKSILSRRMSDQQIFEACAQLKELGIRIYAVNMLGLPNETEEQMFKTVALNHNAGVDFADASIFQPYPGTRITEYCKQIGALDEGKDSFESQFTTSVLNFPPRVKSRIETIHRLFSIMVDHPWVEKLYPLLASASFLRPILNLFYRFYYGSQLHQRIYAGQIPFLLRLRGAVPLLFSRNRI